MITRAVRFLQKYRVLEGILEKQYANRRSGTSSPVIEYLHDSDSEPVRTDLNLMREIRNILSHNSDSDGDPVIEPSEETLDRLDSILAYITRKRRADQYGTDAAHILFAHPTDPLMTVMNKMHQQGFSQVPVIDEGTVRGVLTVRSIFDFQCDQGMDSIGPNTRVCDLKEYTRIKNSGHERFMFISADTDIDAVRKSFNRHWERNRRLTLVLVTLNGSPSEPLLRLITPWDAISDFQPEQEDSRHD